jgi:hypothetical protein
MTYPTPAQFTKGSKWRFICPVRRPGMACSTGDEFEIVSPIDNVTRVVACRGIHSYRAQSDRARFPTATGSLPLGAVIKFVEQVEAGSPIVYYLKMVGKSHVYYVGASPTYQTTHHFDLAKYWESKYFALKALYRQNSFYISRRLMDRFCLMSYNSVTDEHCEIHIPQRIREAVAELNSEVVSGGSKTANAKMLALILKEFDDFRGVTLVKFPTFSRPMLKAVFPRHGIKLPLAIVGRYAAMRSLEDAVMAKMAFNGCEIKQI